ncbi:MAG: hypothetical protein IT376_18500 [Polyangiaceae bacterium]|nr:hypothetical protein [Polyangiaceae bacterium]
MTRTALATALAALATGCWFPSEPGDARLPGEELGTYAVVGTLDPGTCGAGALGAPAVWRFEVRLSRDASSLYWLNGEAPIEGTVGADGAFEIVSETRVGVLEPERDQPGCGVIRRDRAAGRLDGAALDVPSFAGELRYEYASVPGSDCSALVGADGGFERLPCALGFALSATRVRAPGDGDAR